ncbi:hypothetical protein [Salidesulfovibrio onnuriiensis]|uniref:hypothetical protein n=1 Tax=Salidesulfovibrio onnuriiensis TaxID=2583823 RepID=UPI0011CA5B9A|nr:hypothetical protein [Salidesulfovibrio onnuriiensis]
MNVDAIRQYQRTQAIPAQGSGAASGRETPSARLKCRTVGFSLGKLGIEFSSRDMELDQSLSPEAAESRRKANAYGAERQVEGLRAQVAQQAVNDRQASFGSGECASLFQRRRGLAAYSQTTTPEAPLPGSMFKAAV